MSDHPPSVALIQEWRQKRLITADTHALLVSRLRSPVVWRRWASWNLMGLGTALVLAGTIFFFAYNWQGMSRLERLAVAQTGLFAAALGSRLVGRNTLIAHLLTLSACVMIGVFLAVFGQAYQTGANTYELFIGWAALMFLWVLAQGFAPLWVLWLGVLSAGIWFYQADATSYGSAERLWRSFFWVGTMYGGALIVREALQRGLPWLQAGWLRIWLLFQVLAHFTIPAIVWAYSLETDNFKGPGALLWGIACLAGFAFHRYCSRSLGGLGLVLCSACAVLLSFLARLFFENGDGLDAGILYGLVATAILGGLVALLHALGKQMAREGGASNP